MQTIRLFRPKQPLTGTIELTGSKSIGNRALIIRALCDTPFAIERMPAANDTELMVQLLQRYAAHGGSGAPELVLDAGPAGTTYRFLTAFLAFQPGVQLLTGTDRMKQRPIGTLVEALRQFGADIEYTEREGYPPLRIRSPKPTDPTHRELSISAGTSSQYISALLMLAPTLPNGLQLTLEGEIVSRPYIEMTLALMRYFGVLSNWEGQTITVAPQRYQARPFRVEADWSAASYYYSMAALAEEVRLEILGLHEESVQGDAVVANIYEKFGVRTSFTDRGIVLEKNSIPARPVIEYDFLRCPDLAQTVAVTCAGLGTEALYTGLQTLKIKETDRIAALRTELEKVGVFLAKLPAHFSSSIQQDHYLQEGHATFGTQLPRFATYEDHRMAMAFAPLAMVDSIEIEEPEVVKKSYPDFWADLQRLGFQLR